MPRYIAWNARERAAGRTDEPLTHARVKRIRRTARSEEYNRLLLRVVETVSLSPL